MASKEIAKVEGLSAGLVIDVLSGAVDPARIVFSAPDREATAKRIAEKDLNAESLDDLLGSSSLINGKDYVGKGFKLESVEWQESTLTSKGGLPFYSVLHGITPAGKPVTIGCGATAVMRKAARMSQAGWLPAWVKITAGKPTEEGNVPLDLADGSEFAPFGN